MLLYEMLSIASGSWSPALVCFLSSNNDQAGWKPCLSWNRSDLTGGQTSSNALHGRFRPPVSFLSALPGLRPASQTLHHLAKKDISWVLFIQGDAAFLCVRPIEKGEKNDSV